MYIIFKNDQYIRMQKDLPYLDSDEFISYKTDKDVEDGFYDFFIDKANNMRFIPKQAGLLKDLKRLKLRHRIRYALEIIRG